MNKDFLLEIGTEEIPASWLQNTSTQLANKISELFSKEEISYDKPKKFYTPRRIAVLIRNVATKQKDKSIEITGPPKETAFDKNGDLTKAGIGFAKAHKVSSSEIKIKKKGEKEVIYCQKLKKGKETPQILKSALPDIISQIEFPKSMRWESSGFKFARPIRSLLALFGNTIIPFEIAGVKSANKTQGLRGTPQITIKSATSYERVLKSNDITLDPSERLNLIIKRIQELCGGKDFSPEYGAKLLGRGRDLFKEVTNLVECPKAILGKFDKKYLKLPKEVIIAAMETHQRYFALERKDRTLVAYFIVIANTKDGALDKIREGHERVLQARLEDAEFYYREDIKVSIEKRVPELKEVIWQEGLGTLYDKTERLIELSKYIADNFIPQNIYVELDILRESANLCKVDLLTNMIKDGKEFTELEGLYGSILAKEQGLDPKVVSIIKNYSSSNYPLLVPNPETVALGIADRIDTIVGAFILGKIPTGSKDPLGIRRAGNELLNIITENNIHISLKKLALETLDIYKKVQSLEFKVQMEKISEFWIQRFRKNLEEYLKNKGFKCDIVDAIILVNDDIRDLQKRAIVLTLARITLPELVTLAKRVRNILKSEKLKVKSEKCKIELLREPEEKELYNALIYKKKEFENHIEERNYESALNGLLNLAPLINKFFDKVLVMAKEPDVRGNRLALLNELYSFFQRVADFSKLAE